MNRKGFTLIELLAVIVILLGISLTTVWGINASLGRRDVKECEEQKELAINSAKIYFSLNNVTNVTIGTLKSGDYLNDDKVDRLKDSDKITIDVDGYSYSGTTCSEE